MSRIDVIVKYQGDIDNLSEYGFKVVKLIGGFAIVSADAADKTIKNDKTNKNDNILYSEIINILRAEDTIIYIEEPDTIYYGIVDSVRTSCMSPVQFQYKTYGQGIFVAIIDSGIDYTSKLFMNNDGTTRIACIWDMTDNSGTPPAMYGRGTLYTKTDIDNALKGGYKLGTKDVTKHGTAVAGICCGNFTDNLNNNVGIATKSTIIAVKLGNDSLASMQTLPTTATLMMAVDFAIRVSLGEYEEINRDKNVPLVINLSFGNSYGPHDGSSMVDLYLTGLLGVGKNTIVAGAGNEGDSGGHYRGVVDNGGVLDIFVAVAKYEQNYGSYDGYYDMIRDDFTDNYDINVRNNTSIRIDLYKEFGDNMDISIILPNGSTYLAVKSGRTNPFTMSEHVRINLPTLLTEGIYTIRIKGIAIKTGIVDMWLSSNLGEYGVRFLNSVPEITLTEPGTAYGVITVGAYNPYAMTYATFSGRGYLRNIDIVKPELVAPGVNISTVIDGENVMVTGTSFATPIVSGAVALLMEWGIKRGNDDYMYGLKVKSWLIRNCRQIGNEPIPNNKVGYGTLCLKFPIDTL